MFLQTHIKETCEGQSPNDGVSNPESDEDQSPNDGVANKEHDRFEVLGLGPPQTPSRNTIWATNFNEVPNPVLRLAENSQNQVPKSGSIQKQNEVTGDDDDYESEFEDIEDSDDVYEPEHEEIRQAKKEEAEDYDDEVEEPKPPKGIVIPYNVNPDILSYFSLQLKNIHRNKNNYTLPVLMM